MRGAFAPRFAIEVAFLILLGVGAGYADLRPAVIVGVLAGGWVLVSLIELAVWRSQARAAPGPAAAIERAEAEPRPEVGPELEEVPEPDDDYPLRSDAGDARSEEVEEYTRILSASSAEERSSAQPGG
jgi:hypothetical protein